MAENDAPRQQNPTPGRRQLQLLLIVMAALGLGPTMLVDPNVASPYTSVFYYFIVYIAGLVGVGTYVTKQMGTKADDALEQSKKEALRLASAFNERVVDLEHQFKYSSEKDGPLSAITSHYDLRSTYSDKYSDLLTQFKQERQRLQQRVLESSADYRNQKMLWGWIFVIGFCSALYNCASSGPEPAQQPTVATLADGTQQTLWNADNIPIPYLQDSTQYVSNPDHVLTQGAVNHINKKMKQLENELDIQSVVIVVNNIENDDPYRMAQDVGNRYGVGRNDRGLVVVVGYLDHSVNITPGRALEADLTDAECRQLQQNYVIPCMRLEQPDSAMVYLSDALYATLKSKEMPQLSPLLDGSLDDDQAGSLGLYASFLMAWLIFLVYKNKKYMWFGTALAGIMANPFVDRTSGGSGFVIGGGGGGGFGGGSFGGGGGFGGGSFGGGGATSRW